MWVLFVLYSFRGPFHLDLAVTKFSTKYIEQCMYICSVSGGFRWVIGGQTLHVHVNLSAIVIQELDLWVWDEHHYCYSCRFRLMFHSSWSCNGVSRVTTITLFPERGIRCCIKWWHFGECLQRDSIGSMCETKPVSIGVASWHNMWWHTWKLQR